MGIVRLLIIAHIVSLSFSLRILLPFLNTCILGTAMSCLSANYYFLFIYYLFIYILLFLFAQKVFYANYWVY